LDESCYQDENKEWNQALRLLLLAAAIRPALIAPDTNALRLLSSVHLKIDALSLYCQEAVNFSKHRLPLDYSALKRVKSEVDWQQEVDTLLLEVSEWLKQAGGKTMKFQPATEVWLNWLKPGGLINALLTPVAQNDTAKREEVHRNVELFSNESAVEKQMHYTDRKVLKRRAGNDIHAKALGQFMRHVREATNLAQRWLDTIQSSPNQSKGNQYQKTEEVRERLLGLGDKALQELKIFARSSDLLSVKCAARICTAAVNDVAQLLNEGTGEYRSEPLVKHIILSDLLRMEECPIENGWRHNAGETERALDQLIVFVSKNMDIDYASAFDLHNQAGNHEGAALVIEYMSTLPDEAGKLSNIEMRHRKALEDSRISVQDDVNDTRRTVGYAVSLGLFTESEQAQLDARVREVEIAKDNVLRFGNLHSELRSIREEVETRRLVRVEETRRRLRESGITEDSESYRRIESVLSKDDVFTANDYIQRLLDGESLPALTDGGRDVLHDFFCEKFAAIEDYLEPKNPQDRRVPAHIIEDVRKGRSKAPVDLRQIPGAQLSQAADLLKCWFEIKRKKSIDVRDARELFRLLGFNPLDCSVEKRGQYTWLDVRTDGISDRNRCPVPEYGSEARGFYRVLCLWDRPSPEVLLHTVGADRHGHALVVLHFGRMLAQRRRELARTCRERRRTVIVLDETLILYLAGERGDRLPVFFDCALPFTAIEPYSTTAGLVAPEMFYGRQKARDYVIRPDGSCFIYGGRQLGKTALLRDVERSYHNPPGHHIAVWCDLKAEGIGYNRSVDEIWPLIASRLRKDVDSLAKLPSHTGPDRLLECVTQWIDGNPQRRILLLLDEADRFLESDSKDGFIRCAKLKLPMDRTQRRFKVVFAGLHNVQRATKDPNHPLAHFTTGLGEAICIGPLLQDGEWRDARALVEQPLASAGYRFESEDLVFRILSQTNYYPSLIQLYCSYLIQHVTDRQTLETFRNAPPYIITSRHVEEAYQGKSLRRAIRDRFIWTLDLDPRYRLIAYVIALYSSGIAEETAVKEFSASWIRDQAFTFWPQGFRECRTLDSLRILLDEMVGLGVLRAIGEDNYSLRNPNVIALIGSYQEIESELDSFVDHDPPAEYDASSFRSSLGDNAGDRRGRFIRNPLTAEQEAQLRLDRNAVAVVFGTEAAGLSDLGRFLLARNGQEYFIEMSDVANAEDFRRRLNGLEHRKKTGTTIVFVSSGCPWSYRWVEIAAEKTHKLTSKTAHVEILFAADPRTTWDLVGLDGSGLKNLKAKCASTLLLRPWHDAALRQSLDDDSSILSSQEPEKRLKITEATGNWPILLYRWHRLVQEEKVEWQNALRAIWEALGSSAMCAELAGAFGLDFGVARSILSDLQQLDAATIDELVVIVDDEVKHLVRQTITWADLLSLVIPAGNGTWQVDPVVGHILMGMGKQ